MLIKNNEIWQLYQVPDTKRDISNKCAAIENCIKLLSAEICRLSRLSYSSWGNLDRIRSLDSQIEYLEQLLAAYETDMKKYE